MNLTDIRSKIDNIDDELLELFLKRMELSEQVAQYKRENSLPIYNSAREREILTRITEKSGEREMYAYRLFGTLFDVSRARQRELISQPAKVSERINAALSAGEDVFPKTGSVACQGIEGSNSQAACEKLISRANTVFVKSFEAVFDAVESGLCKYGVLPIENSSNGSVRSVYELLQHKNFSVVRSIRLCIRHELLAKPGTKLQDITKIYSHEQAIGQCSKFLNSLGENVTVIPCSNTAVASKRVSEDNDMHSAAISSHRCTDIYGLNVLNDEIQNSDNNYTRFICITKEPTIYAGADRISLIIDCANKPGALNDILSRLSTLGINMSKLESCPVSGRNFEFIFLLELEASVKQQGVIQMLEDLERTGEHFTFLGNYSEV